MKYKIHGTLYSRFTLVYSIITASLILYFQESCNNDLEWYKSVKETQGSVETTSTGQMMNILKYGTYTVSFREEYQSTVCSVHSLVDVTLTQEYQKLAKTKYTLDELRDLESKLVLICGNKAETKAEVDHYLNVSFFAQSIDARIQCA